jgi:hypothetical protein
METVLYLVVIVSWIWSVARGIQVSILCAALNFIFPPVSQIIFAVYEEKMRTPLLLMAVGGGLLFFLYGEATVTFSE